MIQTRWLGRMPYSEALDLQERTVRDRISGGDVPDQVLLLEHEPVYTIGRLPDQSSLRNPEKLGHPVVQVGRGGQATYHGPGQLIGYPILDLRTRGQDLHRYMRVLEAILIEALGAYGLVGERREGLTGVWIRGRKVASIGVGVRRWISLHGFALVVGGDLSPFHQITPCGIQGVEMTSVSQELDREVGVQEMSEVVAQLFTVDRDWAGC